MNASTFEEYRNWISDLSENNFNELVLNYIKEYYNTKDAYISNGPYDGGNDVIINIDGKDIKRNIQVTVQKSNLNKKIIEDVIKANANVTTYSYLNKLDFYCSQHITGKKQNELKLKAFVDYNIDLNIIDNYKLAELAPEYKSILKTLKKVKGYAFPTESLSLDRNTKILFDSLSTSSDIGSIKISFIISYILFHVYNNGASTANEIFDGINAIFYNKFKKSYYEDLIGKLNLEGELSVINSQEKPKRFDLSASTRQRLEEIEARSVIAEKSLIEHCHKIIRQYGLELNVSDIVQYIIKMFNENYAVDIDEITKESDNHHKHLKKIYSELLLYIRKNSDTDEKLAKQISNELIQISNANTIINKSSISKMFINLFQDDKLDDYLNTSERKLYLDTQILLQIICVYYKNIQNPDMLYSTVRCFLDAIKDSDIPVSLHTTNGYINEVAAHLHNALKLERFLRLDYIKSLGPSKNVFFNFYISLRDTEEYESFTDFISQMLDIEESDTLDNFIYVATESLRDTLELLGINIESTPYVEYEEYQNYKKEYENTLSYNKLDQKSYGARKNDLDAILYISKEIAPNMSIPPYLITWDSSFYKVRQDFKRLKELKYWHIYSPQKFTNTIFVLNFKIDPSSVNNNIISLVEENFNTSNSTISFLDVLNNLFDKKDLSEWELARKFASLRNKLEKEGEGSKIEFVNLPIDELLLLIQNNYYSSESSKDLIALFQNNKYADMIMEVIHQHIGSFKTHDNKLKTEIISKLDLLIKENKEELQND